jgi:hypothetical protein
MDRFPRKTLSIGHPWQDFVESLERHGLRVALTAMDEAHGVQVLTDVQVLFRAAQVYGFIAVVRRTWCRTWG